jgi:hypothetical protein
MNNWRRTINKCDLHREMELTGNKLLEEVRKLNREYSPKTAEPDTLEGILGVDFEPDWLKQIRKYPSIEKLQETKFNLETVKAYSPISREFQYCLSNFLNSSSSVLWYLLEEYSRKYKFEIDKYRKDERYAELRRNSLSEEAKEYLSWYDAEFIALQDSSTGFLLKKRDTNIHVGYIELIFRIRQPFKVEGNVQQEIPVDMSNTFAYFPEDQNTTALELCSTLINLLKSLVDRAHQKFPL